MKNEIPNQWLHRDSGHFAALTREPQRWNAEEETQTEKVPYGHAFLV